MSFADAAVDRIEDRVDRLLNEARTLREREMALKRPVDPLRPPSSSRALADALGALSTMGASGPG